MERIRGNYNHTLYASYLGYITQAVINNFVPLLFLTFQGTYGISLDKIAFLVTLNFGTQLLVDALAAKFVDRIGYRCCVVMAHVLVVIGFVGLAVLPDFFEAMVSGGAYIGLMLPVVLYAIGGGLIEVLISPIVEACPTDKKEGAMSLLHSFYCWGHVFVVIASTLFFALIGIENWRLLACIWAVIPLLNCFYFALVPIRVLVEDGQGMTIGALFKNKMFWILLGLMVCSGASEQGMSQWASAFAEMGLGVSKAVGDLAGPCAFAFLMGCSRLFYGKFSEKIHLERFMILSSVLCVLCYFLAALAPIPILSLLGCALCGLSVGIMWPGSFSIAAKALSRGGTAMFALLALAGDLGCSLGPGVVGFVSGLLSDNLKLGVLAAVIFPVGLLGGIFAYLRVRFNSNKK